MIKLGKVSEQTRSSKIAFPAEPGGEPQLPA